MLVFPGVLKPLPLPPPCAKPTRQARQGWRGYGVSFCTYPTSSSLPLFPLSAFLSSSLPFPKFCSGNSGLSFAFAVPAAAVVDVIVVVAAAATTTAVAFAATVVVVASIAAAIAAGAAANHVSCMLQIVNVTFLFFIKYLLQVQIALNKAFMVRLKSN